MCKEKELKEQQNERLTVKKGEVHFLSKEEVEKGLKAGTMSLRRKKNKKIQWDALKGEIINEYFGYSGGGTCPFTQ